MLHPIFNLVADRIFTQDPILRKIVIELQKEETEIEYDEKNTDRKILQRD